MRVLAIDQGTTGSRAIIYDAAGQVIADAYREFKQHYPQPGWVEHDPEDIWQSIVDTVTAALAKSPGPVDAVGITNQRETTVVWDRETGNPIYNAIVWQCRRTAERCQALVEHAELIRAKTGLPLDAYFSGTKINWILENVKIPDVDRLLCGTIDTWLIWKLTGGQVHATDYTNASRTLLFNIKDRKWDDELCSILSVPASLLPTVKRSMDDYGTVTTIEGLLDVPILGVAGDQQAALFGQTCFADGQTKSTYGTGAFLLMNTGSRAVASANGLLTTLAVDADGA
ncbi:MAG: FGGY family carbohydrate kinase, partial [Verrucomicrobia bacterium]|nr:FGGY family carbohydrate kinase [Verrucomicrobiota bacterium]